MWPDSKGKGGKDSSPKSKDGGGDTPKSGAGGGKSGGKGRNTRTKMKAITAEGSAIDPAQASAKLEQDIIKAAQNLSQSQPRLEETKTLVETNRVPDSAVRQPGGETATSASLMRLPEANNESMGDKISGLWKNRVLGAYRANPRASQHILPAMPNNRGALEITDKARADAQQNAMIVAVDKMFDVFQNLAFEFNQVASSDLELTWIRPVISRENISSWHQAAQIVSVFTGRISTRRWTMVVRGTLDSVLAYCIPADKLLSFSNQPANFQPVIELIPVADGLAVRWSVMNRQASAEDLDNVYRALLDNMIRIAQDDAPCDQLIDLSAYGVTLSGAIMDVAGLDRTPPEAMGANIDYSNKYQQEFSREDGSAGSMPGKPVSSVQGNVANPFARQGSFPAMAKPPEPQTPAAGNDSVDWKPVVHSVRGANPPGGQDFSQATTGGHSAVPSTPGFNDDEPWKYGGPATNRVGTGTMAGGPGSINSVGSNPGFNSQSGFGQSFGQTNPQDEPPLPALPAHLFEGLPPRPQQPPQAAPSAFGGNQPGMPSSPSSEPRWNVTPLPPGATGTSSSASNPALQSPRSDDDGWRSADIPAPRGNQALPPPPVSQFQGTSSSYPALPNNVGTFSSPQNNSLTSLENFSSGNIRVDALAKEIAQSALSLPSAIPGFEPYTVDGTSPTSSSSSISSLASFNNNSSPFSSQSSPPAPPASPASSSSSSPSFGTSSPPSFPSAAPASNLPSPPPPTPAFSYTSTNNSVVPAPIRDDEDSWDEPDNKPWPKPREHKRHSYEDANEFGTEKPQSNAFINFENEPAAELQNPDADDPEIVALFEGEPVNAPAQPEPVVENVQPVMAAAVDIATPAETTAEPTNEAVSLSSPEAISQVETSTAEIAEAPSASAFATESSSSYSSLEPVPPPAAAAPVAAPPSMSSMSEAIKAGFMQARKLQEESDAQSQSSFDEMPAAEILPPPPVVTAAESGGVRSLKADLDRLLASLDSELEVVSAKGSEAFGKRDLKGAERMIKLAETLGEFKESLTKLRHEHDADLS